MGRKYEIESETVDAARQWIKHKLDNEWPRSGLGASDSAKSSFKQIERYTPKEVNKWAEANMNAKQWATLKTYLRVNRKRANDKREGKYTKSLDVTSRAYLILKSIAVHEKITISKVIEIHLEKRWNEVLEESGNDS